MRRILNPALNHELVGEVERVLQIVQSDHQPDGYTGTTHSGSVERTEALDGSVPINRASEFY